MAKDRIEKNDVISPDVNKEIEDLNKNLATSVKLMTDLTKASIDLSRAFNPDNIQQVVDSQKEYNKVNEESQETNKKSITTLEKLQQKIRDVNEEEERAKIALQEKRKAVRANIKVQKDQTKETIKLNRELKKEVRTEKEATAQNKLLLKIRKEVDITTAKGAKQVTLINKKIDQNNDLLKENASKLGKQKIGVGKYKESITEALQEQEFFGISLNKISSGLKSGVGIFGAAVAVVAGLGKAYASSARGAEDLARVGDRLQSVVKKLGNSIADASGESNFFDAVVRELQIKFLGIASTLESDIQVSILSTIRELGVLEAQQEKQKKSQLDRAEVLRQIRDEERNSFEDRKAANLELGKVIDQREKDTVAFQEKILVNLKALLALNKGDLELQQQIAQVEFEIADAREEAQGFRSEMLMNDLALGKEFVANELELQQLIIAGEMQKSEDVFNLRKRLIDITRQLDLEAAGENQQLIDIALQKAENAENALTEEVIKGNEARNEARLSGIEKTIAILDEEVKREIDAADAELQRLIDHQDDLTNAEISEINKRTLAQIEANEKKKESNQEYIRFASEQAQNLSMSILSLLDNQITAQRDADIEKAQSRGASEEEILRIEKKAANERKNIAYLDIAINTALGVTKAFVENNWVEALLISAGIIAEGAIQVAAIESASFAKGVSDSGDSWLHATVAEKGVERINLADGTSFLTPNTQTQMLLPPHSEVIPNHRLQQDLAEMQMVGNNRGTTQENDRRRKEEQKEIIKAIRNRDETTINITEGGIYVNAKIGANRVRYINRKYRR